MSRASRVFRSPPPPVGPLRWRAPQPAADWRGIRVADHFAPDCLQEAHPSMTRRLPSNRRKTAFISRLAAGLGDAANTKLPVMVWIYGGGMVSGGTSPAIYDGTAFAHDGVIFVSFNYRVGRFGYFAFPALTREDADHGLLGNYGLTDQIAALKWRPISRLSAATRTMSLFSVNRPAAWRSIPC
ncbi:MAG: carboxylesterase family protein [Asticcacaulis sp.]